MTEAIELAVVSTENPAAKNLSEDSIKTSSGQTEDESALIGVVTSVSEQTTKPVMAHQIWTGNTIAMCFYNGYPLITIGPHCSIFVIPLVFFFTSG